MKEGPKQRYGTSPHGSGEDYLEAVLYQRSHPI